MNKVYEIKDGERTVLVELVEIEGVEFYTIDSDYYTSIAEAENDGYYWDDELEKWTKEIMDDTTTIF